LLACLLAYLHTCMRYCFFSSCCYSSCVRRSFSRGKYIY
jgi:hypothetical protein